MAASALAVIGGGSSWARSQLILRTASQKVSSAGCIPSGRTKQGGHGLECWQLSIPQTAHIPDPALLARMRPRPSTSTTQARPTQTQAQSSPTALANLQCTLPCSLSCMLAHTAFSFNIFLHGYSFADLLPRLINFFLFCFTRQRRKPTADAQRTIDCSPTAGFTAGELSFLCCSTSLQPAAPFIISSGTSHSVRTTGRPLVNF